MTKRLLAYSPLAIWHAPSYETQLEIIQNFIDDGFAVTMLTCDAHLPTCEANPRHRWSTCVLCRSRAQSGIDWIGDGKMDVMDYLSLTAEQNQSIEALVDHAPTSVAGLRSLVLDGSDIGMAVLSSLVSIYREPNPDLVAQRDLVQLGLRAAAQVHYSIRNHIEHLRPDALLLFNGRIQSLRPALRAGQSLRVKTLVCEVAGAPDRYLITTNTYPHDLDTLKGIFNITFDTAPEPPEERATIAKAWYDARIANRPYDGMAFAGEQQIGLLPEELASNGLRVGVFISSEDEFVAIDGWEPPLYGTQADGLRHILADFANRDDIQFILRIHPHLRGIDNSQTRELEAIGREYPRLHLVRADSPVHTYTLIEAVDIVLTFGSTVAIEAVYLGKPSIMLGRHIFEDMGGVVRPSTHAELVDMLSKAIRGEVSLLRPDAQDAMVRFGFAQSRFGIPYRHVRRPTPTTAVLIRGASKTTLGASFAARLATTPPRAMRWALRKLRNRVRLGHRHRTAGWFGAQDKD